MEKLYDEIYCPECGKRIKKDVVNCTNCGIQMKTPILLIYPICFLAGMGIMLILTWLMGIITWLNDSPLDFNLIFKSWSSLIAYIFGAIFFSGFVFLWLEIHKKSI